MEKNLVGAFVHQQQKGFEMAQLQPLGSFLDGANDAGDVGFHVADHQRDDQYDLGNDHQLYRKQQLPRTKRPHAGKEHIKKQTANHGGMPIMVRL